MTFSAPSLLVATRNAGKLREMGPMVAAAGFHPVSLADAGVVHSDEEDALEAFDTFEENALAKARWFQRLSQTSAGLGVLADDSGLVVQALGGTPGVRSKRWSGSTLSGAALDDENNHMLVRALRDTSNRRAKYVCVAAIVWPGGELLARGECTGVVVETPRGESGFGYDSHFMSDDLGMTFGEAGDDEKGRVSHRARAVRRVLEQYLANVTRRASP
ncbi:MAG TPA: non-canonical purine NTP pyrophosphatase [Gemmatimonadaceae bacterium]|nr:non-canonical purine NTP pyrophosphatase [Gemmatimonadaceae bacterium]